MKAVLSSNPDVVVLASEEDDAAIPCSSSSGGSRYAVVFDPLDGSRNITAAIPTGKHTCGKGSLAAQRRVRHVTLRRRPAKSSMTAAQDCPLHANISL